MTITSASPRKLALIGVSHRSIRICKEVPESLADQWQVTALWDIDERRFAAYRNAFPNSEPAHYLGNDAFPDMLAKEQPDLVFIATRDCNHAEYIILCLAADIDVVVEKPMVINSEQARAVLAAEAASKANIHVAFNYRYEAIHEAIKHELDSGLIGRITAVEMNVYLDEQHGSSFFQRWNRYRNQSGGLTIHKEGHYLDLINWWIQQKPVELYGYSALNYYGPDSEHNPQRVDGRHCSNCEHANKCAYQQTRTRKDSTDDHFKGLVHMGKRHRNLQWYSDYQPDACIFDSDIDIEDTYASVIRYDGGTMATFSVNFSSPFEQYRIVFNGTKGRLEYGYAFGKAGSYGAGRALVHYPLFSDEPRIIPVENRPGGHGGGDPTMLEDICSDCDNNTCRASARDGAYAVALGEAMWRSPLEKKPIRIADLLQEWY